MKTPKFLLGDNSQNEADDIFIIHTAFPRFIINLKNDEIELWETIDKEDKKEWANTITSYIEAAGEFYEREIAAYENEN